MCQVAPCSSQDIVVCLNGPLFHPPPSRFLYFMASGQGEKRFPFIHRIKNGNGKPIWQLNLCPVLCLRKPVHWYDLTLSLSLSLSLYTVGIRYRIVKQCVHFSFHPGPRPPNLTTTITNINKTINDRSVVWGSGISSTWPCAMGRCVLLGGSFVVFLPFPQPTAGIL